jgi:hypothetical protein
VARHQSPSAPRGHQAAARILARGHGSRARAQPQRTARHQRQLRRGACVRVGRGASEIDRSLIEEVLVELESTGVLPRAPPDTVAPAFTLVSEFPVEQASGSDLAADAPPTATSGRVLHVHRLPHAPVFDRLPKRTSRRLRSTAVNRPCGGGNWSPPDSVACAEEYRRLRSQRSMAESTPPAAATDSPRRPRVAVTTAHATRCSPNHEEGFWGRMKRVMLGESAPDVEKN